MHAHNVCLYYMWKPEGAGGGIMFFLNTPPPPPQQNYAFCKLHGSHVECKCTGSDHLLVCNIW
jgi:hypothetical protein